MTTQAQIELVKRVRSQRQVCNMVYARLTDMFGSQRAAAQAMGVSESLISHIKKGRRPPTEKMLELIGAEAVTVYLVKPEDKANE